MASRSIPPTADPDSVIEEPVGGGLEHDVVGAAVRDAVRDLRQRLQAEQLKLELLGAQVNAGLDALEHGAGAAVAPSDINAIIASLAASAAP